MSQKNATTTKKNANGNRKTSRMVEWLKEYERCWPGAIERMNTSERDLEAAKVEIEALKKAVEYWKNGYFQCFEENICLRAFGVDSVPEKETLETIGGCL